MPGLPEHYRIIYVIIYILLYIHLAIRGQDKNETVVLFPESIRE